MGVRAGQGAKGHSLPFDKAQGKEGYAVLADGEY